MQDNCRNIYRNARSVAGLTQERWAEALGCSVESVRLYETGRQTPPDELVRAMAEISGLTPLAYWHLVRKGSLAADLLPEVEQMPLPQAAICLLRAIRDFVNRHRTDQLLDIAADGRIDAVERQDFDVIVAELEEIVRAAMMLKFSEGGGNDGA